VSWWEWYVQVSRCEHLDNKLPIPRTTRVLGKEIIDRESYQPRRCVSYVRRQSGVSTQQSQDDFQMLQVIAEEATLCEALLY